MQDVRDSHVMKYFIGSEISEMDKYAFVNGTSFLLVSESDLFEKLTCDEVIEPKRLRSLPERKTPVFIEDFELL